MAFINGKEVLFSGYGNIVVDETAIYDVALNGGKRTNLEYAFNHWQMEYIRPPFVVKPTGRYLNVFSNNHKLKKIEKQYFDFSGCSTSYASQATSGAFYTAYYCSNLEEFEDIGLPDGTYTSTWGTCLKLRKIELVRSRKETPFSSPFSQCVELEYIRFDGEIGQNISFSYSGKLSVESVIDILQHLADLTGESAKTITFHDDVKTRMAQQGAIAELDGKTYDAYITDKGWNLA